MKRSAPNRSPLDPVFEGHARVPFAFAEQFLHSDDRPYGMRLDGAMKKIWHQPAVLSPLFRLLGKLGILVPYQGEDIPTSLIVRPGRDPEDGPYHIWDRTFTFAKPVRFPTTILYDPTIGKVVDLVGPKNMLYMVWDAQFHPPDRFTLDTHSCAIRLRGRKFWMPRWMWKLLLGEVSFSQVAASADGDTVHVNLLIMHPLLGEIFGYEGVFRTVRTEKAEQAGSAG